MAPPDARMTDAAAPHEPTHDARGRGAINTYELPARNGWRMRTFGTSVRGVPLEAWWPSAAPTRVVWGAIHGEESVTLQLLRHLLAVVHADDACAVVIPVLNPDGVLAGTRQNARGVDLNRNFATSTWSDAPQPTFWSTTQRRTPQERVQLSSTGSAPGSEPEVAALCALLMQVRPQLVVDVHTPLECVFAFDDASVDFAAHLAEPGALAVRRALDDPTTGDSAAWCVANEITPVTYETELAPMPALWARHRDALVRMIVERRG